MENLVQIQPKEILVPRLLAVNNTDHVASKFIPLLVKHCGEKKLPQGIVLLLSLAIHDYTQGMPAMMANVMMMYVPEYIKALIEDVELQKEALSYYEQVKAGS